MTAAPVALSSSAEIRATRSQIERAILLSVVIVNYRRWKSSARLVRQLKRCESFPAKHSEIVVVDNHSPPDGVLSKLRRTDGVLVRRWKRNRGFGRAANEGVRLSQGDWVLLLNPDVSVLDGFLDTVLELADRIDRLDPRTAIVGLGVRNADGSYQPSTGPLPSFGGTLLRLTLPRGRRKFYLGEVQSGEVAWASGCCLLVRRQAFLDLGGFDPDFFLYYEDVDLCRRAAQRGYSVRYEPATWIVHHHPLQARPVSARMRLMTRHGLMTYAGKNWPRWQQRWLARLIRAEAWFRGRLAAQRGDEKSACVLGELGALAAEFENCQLAEAHDRLARVLRRWEYRKARQAAGQGAT